MAPLIDLGPATVKQEIRSYEDDQLRRLPERCIPGGTETILCAAPGSGKLQILLSERFGLRGGLQVTGGKRDPSDKTIVDTIERETLEESGISARDKIDLIYLVDEIIVDDVYAMSPQISFVHDPQPFYPVPENEKDKMGRWEWHSLADILSVLEQIPEIFFEPLLKHLRNPVYRQAMHGYIKHMVDNNLIPPQDEILKMLVTES
ncbi:MAG: NUDIX domain-containing protein [Candidatus Dojkabacteria bacterium]